MKGNTCASCTFSKGSNALWITSETGNLLFNPNECGALVQNSEISGWLS
jgi:hypothetical protein